MCGKDIAPHRAAEGISILLWRVLNESGLNREPGITGRSVRLAAGLRILKREGGGIEAAARLLGFQSLDNTAAVLNYQWRPAPDETLGRDRPDAGDEAGHDPSRDGDSANG